MGAWIAPETEIVTLTSCGTHRQTYADTAERAAALANGLDDLRIGVGDRVARRSCGTAGGTSRSTRRFPRWERSCTP